MLTSDYSVNTLIKSEESYLNKGIKKYLQPLMYELDVEFLKSTTIIALKMPLEWRELTVQLFSDQKKKWKLSDVLKDICRKHPFIYTYFLEDASYKGNEPFLFFDKEQFNDINLKEVSLSLASILKEYNREFGWGLDNQLIKEIFLNKNYQEITLYDILSKSYKYAVYSGYFISKLCENSIEAELELYYHEYELNEEKGKKEKIVPSIKYKMSPTLTFRQSSNGGKLHEAISQEFELGAGYFSYVLEMNLLVTPLGKDKIYMNLKPSIRQWITLDGTTDYKYTKENPSVYIGLRNQAGKSYLVHTNFTKMNKDFSEYKLPKVFNDILTRYNISFRDLLDNTKKYVSNNELFIGIPYKQSTASWWSNNKSFDLTGNGITVEESRMFYRKVEASLSGLKIIDGNLDISNSSSKIASKGTSEKIYFSNMNVPSHINQITINVFAAEKKHFNDFIECFLDKIVDRTNGVPVFLGVNSGSKVNVEFFDKVVEMSFLFKEINRSHILIEDRNAKIAEVAHEIDSLLDKDKLNINLFFIPDYQNHKDDKKRDPKGIVRQAFRQLGQRVQFINYRYLEMIKGVYYPNREIDKPNNKLHRFRSAFLDALSKIGIHQHVETKWKEEFVQIGLDIIKLNKKEYYCLTKQVNENVFIKAIGQPHWYLYSDHPIFWEDMLRLPNPKEDNQQWVIDGLAAEIRKEKKHVLLTISAGVRQKVPVLQNGGISNENPFMRMGNVTLIRTCHWIEVPDYYTRGYKKNEWVNTQVEGLFKFSENIIYSLANRGDQIKSQLGKSRIDEEEKTFFKKKNLIELLLIKSQQTNLSNEEILQFVHTTRKQNVSYNSYTNEPQILYYIEQIVNDYK